MSYIPCPGCGTELCGDVESRRYGTAEEIKARLGAIGDFADGDTLIDGVLYDEDGFAIHNRERCKSRRARPDCGHSRDCDLGDGRCGWCVDVASARALVDLSSSPMALTLKGALKPG